MSLNQISQGSSDDVIAKSSLGVQGCGKMRAGLCDYELGPSEDFGSDSREEGDALPWLASLLSS